MRQHKAVIHDGKIPDIKCPLCDKLFQEASHLRRHTNDVHEKVKKYACDLCEWRFAQSGQLKTHKKGKHKIDCWFIISITNNSNSFVVIFSISLQLDFNFFETKAKYVLLLNPYFN